MADLIVNLAFAPKCLECGCLLQCFVRLHRQGLYHPITEGIDKCPESGRRYEMPQSPTLPTVPVLRWLETAAQREGGYLLRVIDPVTGQQKDYVIVPDRPETLNDVGEKREAGIAAVQPVRRSYRHKTCGVVTSLGLPQFTGGTFCVHCQAHFPQDQFVWEAVAI